MSIEAPFARYAGEVLPAYVDYNGHMNLAYYVLMFDQATDTLFDALGIGGGPAVRGTYTTFAAESHILYEREVHEGDRVRVRSFVIGADEKRLHIAHEMVRAGEERRAAFQELMYLCVDLATRRVGRWPAAALARLREAAIAHAGLHPAGLGRKLHTL